MVGSAAKRVRHNWSVRIATGADCRSSSSLKKRPTTGVIPNTDGKSDVTIPARITVTELPEAVKPKLRMIPPATSSRVLVWLRQSEMVLSDRSSLPLSCLVRLRASRRPDSGYCRGRSSSAYIAEKIAVLAPIPNPSVSSAAAVKAGARPSLRSDWLQWLT